MFFHLVVLLVILKCYLTKFKTIKAEDLEDYTKKNDLNFVLLYESSIKDNLDLWESLSEVFDGFAKFIAVEVTSRIPKGFKSSKYPAIKLASRSGIVDFRQKISAHGIYKFGLDEINKIIKNKFDSKGFSVPESFVVTLTEANFTENVQNSADHYLIEFYAPWCGHCKNLAPHWKEAAEKLSGKIKLAAVDCTTNERLAKQFGIKGFPTIKFISAKTDDLSTATEYDGGRTSADIVNWAENKISTLLPPPSLIHAYSQDIIEDECFSKAICIITFLPNRLDSDLKSWKGYIKEVETAIGAYQRSGFGWVWLEGTVEEKFEDAMGVGGFGYPAVVALSYKKKAYSIMKSSFDASSIKAFLGNLGSKAAAPQPIKNEIPAIKDAKEWDGSAFSKSEL